MRKIRFTTRFKRDFKREHNKGKHQKSIDADLAAVVDKLVADTALPLSSRDHPLVEGWSDHRDCHIYPDLVLIYRKPDEISLELVRLGSHSELGI